MNTIEQIEIKSSSAGVTKLTVSSHHVVDLLTHLKDRGLEATGQEPPMFGFDNFPTIYYINFTSPPQVIDSEVKAYLSNKSLKFSESIKGDVETKVIRIVK